MYCPECGERTSNDSNKYAVVCVRCRIVFELTIKPFITIHDIAITENYGHGEVIQCIKRVRQELNCSLLQAKRIVELIRKPDAVEEGIDKVI